MDLSEAVIAWNPNSDQIKVSRMVPGAATNWSQEYRRATGAVWDDVRKLEGMAAAHYVMSCFIGIVVRDKVDIQAAHREFLKISEYRDAIPEDAVWEVA